VTCLGVKEKLSLALRTSELLFGIAQKVTKKARHRPRCSDSRQRIGMPCASQLRRGRLTARPCADSRRARIVRAPLRAIFAEACDARHRKRRRNSANTSVPGLRCSGAQEARCCSPLLHCGGSGRNARSGGAMDRADSAACTGMCTQRNTGELPRTFRAGARKAQCQGRVLFGYFLLHEQEKVTRSAEGRVEALLFESAKVRGRAP